VRASLLEPDVVYDRLRTLGSLSIALRRALNAAGISVGAWNCATLCGNKRFP